jgi:hypothetical protein
MESNLAKLSRCIQHIEEVVIPTFGVGQGPNSSSSPASPAKPVRRRLRSVGNGTGAGASAAAASVRGRLDASSRGAEAATACIGADAVAAGGGPGVVGAAEDRLRCWREGSLRTSSSRLGLGGQGEGRILGCVEGGGVRGRRCAYMRFMA